MRPTGRAVVAARGRAEGGSQPGRCSYFFFSRRSLSAWVPSLAGTRGSCSPSSESVRTRREAMASQPDPLLVALVGPGLGSRPAGSSSVHETQGLTGPPTIPGASAQRPAPRPPQPRRSPLSVGPAGIFQWDGATLCGTNSSRILTRTCPSSKPSCKGDPENQARWATRLREFSWPRSDGETASQGALLRQENKYQSVRSTHGLLSGGRPPERMQGSTCAGTEGSWCGWSRSRRRCPRLRCQQAGGAQEIGFTQKPPALIRRSNLVGGVQLPCAGAEAPTQSRGLSPPSPPSSLGSDSHLPECRKV